MRAPPRQDLLLALAALLLGQLDVWMPDIVGADVTGPAWFVSTCYALTSLSLAWRRRRPFVVALLVLGVSALLSLAVGASEGSGSLVPALVALYSVAAHGTRREAFTVAALAPLVVMVRELNNPGNTSLDETLNALVWDLSLAVAWLLGAYLRTRRLYIAELHDRAARAEREREERARAAVAEERARIARELHDVVAHNVSVMVVQAEAAEEVLSLDPDRSRKSLRTIQHTGRATLTEMRRLLGALRDADAGDASRQPQEGVADIGALVERVREAGLNVDLETSGQPLPLSPGVDLAAYRIAQEALTNVLKHAAASRVTLALRYEPDAVEVEVQDDGRGPQREDGGGHGLLGMRERASLYGGELEVGTAAGGGYFVRARLPREVAF